MTWDARDTIPVPGMQEERMASSLVPVPETPPPQIAMPFSLEFEDDSFQNLSPAEREMALRSGAIPAQDWESWRAIFLRHGDSLF